MALVARLHDVTVLRAAVQQGGGHVRVAPQGPLQAAACSYRFALGPRAGQKVLTLQGAMPRETGYNQTLCADMQGFSLHAAVRRGADDPKRRNDGAATSSARRWPTSACRATPRARCAEVEDTLARRLHAPGDVAAGVHAAAGSAFATVSIAAAFSVL